MPVKKANVCQNKTKTNNKNLIYGTRSWENGCTCGRGGTGSSSGIALSVSFLVFGIFSAMCSLCENVVKHSCVRQTHTCWHNSGFCNMVFILKSNYFGAMTIMSYMALESYKDLESL